jgi:hypothetical protein
MISGGGTMLKIIKRLTFVIIPFICIACSPQSTTVEEPQKQVNQQNYSFKYKGESEHWSAVLVVKVSGKEEYNTITLNYKGSDIKSVGNIKESFILSNGSMSGTDETLRPDGSIVLQGGSTNGALPSKDYVVKATVEWNGKKETFQMKTY